MRMKPHLEYHPRTLILFQTSLHLGKGTKDRLSFVNLLFLIAEELKCGLEHVARLVNLATFLLKFAPFNPYTRFRTDSDPSFIDGAGTIELIVTGLKLDIGLPCLVIGFPPHPSFKDLSGASNVLKKLFQINVFVPELIHAWKEGDGTIEKVARMLNIAGLELGFGVSEPEGHTLSVDIECTFKDGSSTCKLIL